MTRNIIQQVIVCPLLDDRQGLKREDRLCHIPETRALYLATHSGRTCHFQGNCSVCPAFPEAVAEEIRRHAQKTRDEENRRTQAAIRAFVESRSSTSQPNNQLPAMAT